jgi:hypothetical protein
MKNISDLFPWSAEARIISFLLEQREEREMDDFYFASEISRGGNVNVRTIRAKMPHLVEMGIIFESKAYDNSHRTQRGYKLVESPLTQALTDLRKILQTEPPQVEIHEKRKTSNKSRRNP